jgi:hypothetical protein
MRSRGLCVTAAAAAFFVGGQSALAAGPVTFTDPPNDAQGGAPDIRTVVVSNDDSGVIRVRVNLGNQDRLARSSRIYLYVDSDLNPATGAPDALGADFVFLLDGTSRSWEIGQWNASTSSFVYGVGSTARVSYWSGFTIHVNRSELGITSGFKFWLEAQKLTGGATAVDDAAKGTGWGYTLQTGATNPPDIREVLAAYRPAPPRAKRALVFRVTGLSVEGASQLVQPDRYVCSVTLGKQTLRGSGAHRCVFRLPASARRKTLTVRIEIAFRGEVVGISRSFVVR